VGGKGKETVPLYTARLGKLPSSRAPAPAPGRALDRIVHSQPHSAPLPAPQLQPADRLPANASPDSIRSAISNKIEESRLPALMTEFLFRLQPLIRCHCTSMIFSEVGALRSRTLSHRRERVVDIGVRRLGVGRLGRASSFQSIPMHHKNRGTLAGLAACRQQHVFI
jgi:hypothetical protein